MKYIHLHTYILLLFSNQNYNYNMPTDSWTNLGGSCLHETSKHQDIKTSKHHSSPWLPEWDQCNPSTVQPPHKSQSPPEMQRNRLQVKQPHKKRTYLSFSSLLLAAVKSTHPLQQFRISVRGHLIALFESIITDGVHLQCNFFRISLCLPLTRKQWLILQTCMTVKQATCLFKSLLLVC